LSFEATLDETGTWTAEEDDSQGHYRKGDSLEYEQIAPTAYLTFWVGK
jgi:cobalt/nickel transport protein